MKIKYAIVSISLVVVCAIVFLLIFERAFPSLITIKPIHCEESRTLSLDADLLYRQTLNNCGPYSAMAVINILKHEKISPELLASKTKWRIYKNLTFPRGVIKLLNSYTIKMKEYILKHKTKDEKVRCSKKISTKVFP